MAMFSLLFQPSASAVIGREDKLGAFSGDQFFLPSIKNYLGMIFEDLSFSQFLGTEYRRARVPPLVPKEANYDHARVG